MATSYSLLSREFTKLIDIFFYGIATKQIKNEPSSKDDFLEFCGSIYDSNYHLIKEYNEALKIGSDDESISEIDEKIDKMYSDIKINEWRQYFIKNINWKKGIEDFLISEPKSCKYCGITKEQISALSDEGKIITKRWITRGRSLEIDRIIPNKGYIDGNMAYCCYWCNNAKTDEFDENEFKKIGEQIKIIWNKRLAEKGLDQINP